ncbi:MAG TPA: flagellar biosynthetic protein FliR [Bryobacteraceae bacterium]|jgi:flagellar biosynthetic protein FliR|nr:flagellar biosynthetic protein FliR [Bryobacteraceae bacterium]
MGTDLKLELGTLYAFLLVLARVSGVFVFVPLPGIKQGPDIIRAALATSITLALLPSWPVISSAGLSLGTLVGWLLAEAGLGIGVGIAVAFLSEIFQMGAQILSLQAGYSFASTIDPTSGADSSVMLAVAQTVAGLLFFAAGLDHQVLLAFAQSLSTHPPGQVVLTTSMLNQVIQTGSAMFSTGLRLVLPLLAMLLIVDLSLALLARLNSQLQLITLAFPIKMLLTLGLLAWLLLVFPKVFTQASGPVLRLVRQLLLA